MGVPSRTRASTPAVDQTYMDLQIVLGKVRPVTSPGRGPSTSSDRCSDPSRDHPYRVGFPSPQDQGLCALHRPMPGPPP